MNFSILDFTKKIFLYFCNFIFRFTKINNEKILFINFNGKGYGDNPKSVCEYLRKNYPDLDLVWLADSIEGFPSGVRVVKYGSLKAFFEQATSKVWIYNTRAFARLNKRNGQYFVQLWHGSIGFKFLESEANMPEYYIKQAQYDGKVTDLMVSDSRLQTEDFATHFWYNGQIEEFGMPRNDTLFNLKDDLEFQNILKERLQLPHGSKIVLFAPTFRDSGDISYLQIDFNQLIKKLESNINEDVILLIRLHPNVVNKSSIINFNDKIKNVSLYGDMQELLIISDLLITDFSSSITDFILLNKPFIRFATDLSIYKKERGLTNLYFELPDKLVENENELFEISKNIWFTFNYSEIQDFKKNKLKPVFDGKSSEKIGEIVYQISQSTS
ncbi:TPA: CDP-glycerol glycerophosphotransferase family protein [Streptococcus suis]